MPRHPVDGAGARRFTLSQKVYECLFLLDSNRYARDPGSVSTGLSEAIEKLEGEVLASRLWNEQKLAGNA